MSKVSLTAPMQATLLSLQQISKQQDLTQLRLSTGLKVNSAIDNPSSYYTAQSLTNRVDDLSTLLDAMGQGIQTIKAANEGIEKAQDLIEQMKSIAERTNANGKIDVLDKEYFINKVGSNGAVVSTAQELIDAVNSGKETICIYGNIDLGDITTSDSLTLKANQKLVGVEYFGDVINGEGFSSISATSSALDVNLININQTGCLVSDLELNFEVTASLSSSYVINVANANVTADLQNLNITGSAKGRVKGIGIQDGATINLGKKININTQSGGTYGYSIYLENNAKLNILKDSELNINSLGEKSSGIYTSDYSSTTVQANAKVNIKTEDANAAGIETTKNSSLIVQSQAKININTSGTNGSGISTSENSNTQIQSNAYVNIITTGYGGHGFSAGNRSSVNIENNTYVNITTSGDNACGIFLLTQSQAKISGNIRMKLDAIYSCFRLDMNSGNRLDVTSSAKIYINPPENGEFISIYADDGVNGSNVFNLAQGAKFALKLGSGNANWYEVQTDQNKESINGMLRINAKNFATTFDVANTSSWKTADEIIAEQTQKDNETAAELEEKNAKAEAELIANQNLFNNALLQYDSLIKDSAYKGINLLKGDELKINFNEDRSSNLLVHGEDITSEKIGIAEAEWQTSKSIQNSLDQILDAQTKLRETAGKLGNYYSIITERSNFTDKLIQVLEEGADKLTLADINEESANMLALQTRQNLATNALSLASQANQAILKLF